MTPEMTEKLREMWSLRESIKTIAKTLGVSQRAIMEERLKLGLVGRWGKKYDHVPRAIDPKKLHEMIRENWPRQKVADYFCVSIKTRNVWKRKLGIRERFNSTRVLTIPEMESIPALVAEYGSTRAVAEYLGVSIWSVQHWFRKLKKTGGKSPQSTPIEEIQPAVVLVRNRTVSQERREAILAEMDAGETYAVVAARHKVSKESIRIWKKAREASKAAGKSRS